jgi:hypothetical protein
VDDSADFHLISKRDLLCKLSAPVLVAYDTAITSVPTPSTLGIIFDSKKAFVCSYLSSQ